MSTSEVEEFDAPPEESVAPEADTESDDGEQPKGDPSTHFAFDHKVFSVDNSFFRPGDGGKAVFHLPMGEAMAAIAVRALRQEFNIEQGSSDDNLLNIVEKSLKFVREIRPNDVIPREVLDGSASWTVEDRHRMIARGRVTAQLVTWLTGREEVILDFVQLEELSNDPQTKERVDQAFSEIAEKLGLGKDSKQEIVDRIDQLAHELSYIEALRDHFRNIRSIIVKITKLVKIYRGDHGMVENLNRVLVLGRPPVKEYSNAFDHLDAATCEILTVLKTFDDHVILIRDNRNRLHFSFMLWEEIVEAWREQEAERCNEVEFLIRELYRFLAQNFQQTQTWTLSNRG